jgi:outer membrane protein OmpA-like peptidoglycan-associated protein
LQDEKLFTCKRPDMKKKLTIILFIVLLFALSRIGYSQIINLGSAANYAIYSTRGAVSNSGTVFKTRVTGNVGTSSDLTLPGFGNIDGKLTTVSNLVANTQLNIDVLAAYSALNTAIPTFFPASALGNGQILVPGVYSISTPIVVQADSKKMMQLKSIYFDFDKSNIRKDATISLDDIVEIMNENPNMEVNLSSYTDCRGSEVYNQYLSDLRAQESVSYIQQRISKPLRISGKGFGELNPLNKCECQDNVISSCPKRNISKIVARSLLW